MKRNITKRLISVTLALTFTISGFSSEVTHVYADTTSSSSATPIKISMASIENLTSDSAMAVKLQNLAIDQLLRDYNSMDSQISALEKQINTETDSTVLVSLATKLTAAKAAKDAKWKEYQDARENITDVITPQIATIKTQYLAYCTTTLQEKKMLLSIEKSKKDLAIAEKKFALHYISETQLDTIKDAYDKLETSMESIVDSKKSSLEKLFNALGVGADASVEPATIFDASAIKKLDFASSLQSALTKNKAIKDAQDAFNDARNLTVPYYDEDNYAVKVAKTKLTNLQNARTEAFTQSYDALMNAYDDYKKSAVILERDLKKASQMTTKLKLGYISKNQYDDFNRTLEAEKLQQRIDNISLQTKYITVQNEILGY